MQLLGSSYKFLISIIILIFDTFATFYSRKLVHQNGIAIIRVDSIGDFVLWLDAAKEFRDLYPDKKITLIANQIWTSLACSLPYWDDVIPIDRKKFTRNPSYRAKALRQIRNLGVELAIHPTFSREYLRGDSLMRATGALHRIGFSSDLCIITSWQKIISDRWYTQLTPALKEPLMELQRNAEFMRYLGLKNFSARMPSIPALTKLPTDLTINQPYFVIFPGASWHGRLWPVENFSKLLSILTASEKGFAVLCGNHKERPLCDQIIDSSGTEALNLAGKTSLPELVEIIRMAKFLVSGETSGVHIAAAVGIPSICILGGGHCGRFLPYTVETVGHFTPVPVIHRMNCFNCNWQCIQPYEKSKSVPCISKITVHQVLNAIEELQH
jgi:ADP-heptose:LPS heptosyltransferase